MTGILFIFAMVAWLAVVVSVSTAMAARVFMSARYSIPTAILFSIVLLPLPLIDEIVGRRQFEQLCAANSTIQVDRVAARGRTVYLANPPDVEIRGTWVRVVLKPWRFVDSTTGETVVSYNRLGASGGWLYRGLNEGGAPLLFKGSCGPENAPASTQAFAEFGIKHIQPPTKENGATRVQR